jgi:hypothetical protein
LVNLSPDLFCRPIEGWTKECLFDWTSYLKLAIPGLAMLFFEWTIFEIGIVSAGTCFLFLHRSSLVNTYVLTHVRAIGSLGEIDLSVMSIAVQTLYTAFMVGFWALC